MSESVADLYVILRAETATILAGFTETGAAGERMAAQLVAAATESEAAIARMGAAFNTSAREVTAAEGEVAASVERAAASTKVATQEIIATNESMSAAMRATITSLNEQYTALGLKTGATAEEIAAANAKIESGWVRTAESVKASTASIDASMDHMAAQTKLAGLEMEAQAAKTTAATEAMAAKADASSGIMGAAFSKTSMGIVGLAGAVAVESVKMAGDFQAKTDVFATTAGEDVKNMDMIRAGMLQLSTDTGTDAQHMVDAMYKVESSHYHGADALKVLTAATQGAKIENSNLTTTADALTTTMTDFHYKTDDAALAMSKLVAVAGGGKLNMEEMAGSLHTVENVSQNAHLSLDQMGGALATLTMHGQSANDATMNLRNAIQNLAAPNAVATKEMAGLGLNALDLSDHLGDRGLTGTYKILTQAIADHTQNGHVVLDLMQNSAISAEKAQRALTGLTGSRA